MSEARIIGDGSESTSARHPRRMGRSVEDVQRRHEAVKPAGGPGRNHFEAERSNTWLGATSRQEGEEVMTKDERCVCGAVIDRRSTICKKCKRNIVPLVPRHWSETMSADTPLTSKTSLDRCLKFLRGFGGAHEDWVVEIEALQRNLALRNEQIDGYERQLGIDQAGAERTIGSELERLRNVTDVLKTVYRLAAGHATECQCRQCEIFELLEPIVGNTSPRSAHETPALQGLKSWGLSPHLPTCSLVITFATVDDAIAAREKIGACFGFPMPGSAHKTSPEEPSEQPPVETGLRTGELAQLRTIDAAARFYVDSVKPGTGLAWENLMNALFDGRPEKAK